MDERELMTRLASGPVSGDRLARDFGVTRSAVWKRVEALRAAGVPITARAGAGYALADPLDLLDADVIRARLGASASGQAARARMQLEVAWSLDSTNSELLRRTAPASGVSVLLAERQTGGRGRRGRTWASPLAANLYLSVSRGFSTGLARLAGLSLVTGVVLVTVLRQCGVAGVGLKWPNDIMVGGRKLGGVLVEGSGELAGTARAVVGIGLNVRMALAPGQEIGQPWTDLAALLDVPPDRNALAAAVLVELIPAFERFEEAGLSPFLAEFPHHDQLRGQPVAVVMGDHVHHGTAMGIAADGALLVQTDAGLRSFHSGEVSVRRQ